MYRCKPIPDGVDSSNEFRFGIAQEELFDCLTLCESKLAISHDAFGQVVHYLQQLCPDASAILFDLNSFWLIKSHDGVVTKVVKSLWVNKGSKVWFRNFITSNKSPWITRLTDACNLLGVDVVEGDAFLGLGARGRVFKVAQHGEFFALKIVDKRSARLLYQENEALAKAQNTGLTITARGECIDLPDGAALLLSPVGEPLPLPITWREVANLFRLLWQLHAKDVIHGDPRVPNAILHGEKLLWIDLMELRQASPTLRCIDAEILTRSILHLRHDDVLETALKVSIDDYGNSDTPENLNHLITEVCQTLGLST